jgi:hypothetical protein
MLVGLDEVGREAAWREVGEALAVFDGADGFIGPCELPPDDRIVAEALVGLCPA